MRQFRKRKRGRESVVAVDVHRKAIAFDQDISSKSASCQRNKTLSFSDRTSS